jgi:hypothetical protein
MRGSAGAMCVSSREYSGRMKTRISALLIAVAAGLVAASDGQIVFSERSEVGQLWANLSLTYLRVGEPYLPIVIGVQNLSGETLELNRASFRLIGPDGRRFSMADLKTLRKSYEKSTFDRRIMTTNGIPADVWYRQRRLRESNFFPDVSQSRRTTVIDRVTLRRGDGTVDLIYFEAPTGLALGTPFVLEVLPEGWEAPLRLRLILG